MDSSVEHLGIAKTRLRKFGKEERDKKARDLERRGGSVRNLRCFKRQYLSFRHHEAQSCSC